ncbi:site-specific DNA-methyltransferase [Brucella pseudogrignonensis]|uniref:DNA methyltransferase n=1 Tax=Brucella pseudogrignonensis TaxID=419475 RepID=UPI001E2FCC44|nr:DNA methyltransferase [Brucella pseudogrignonensis]MCD4512181.1 site-specific DNA-methyltransferase [Brucella pseudogrignonensis]
MTTTPHGSSLPSPECTVSLNRAVSPFLSTAGTEPICFSRRGNPLVSDPFCGSGSTLVAAQSLGRDFLGIELDREHHATAIERLRGEPAATRKGRAA